jgi:DNA-binding response OmpR family regulator
MGLQSLLLTTDSLAVDQLRTVLRDLGIGIEICEQAEHAQECLKRKHYDVAVLDCEAAGIEEVIAQMRTASTSRRAPLFLIAPNDGEAEMSLVSKAHCLLPRPMQLEKTWRALRTARQQMASSMFSYCRVRVEAAALLRCPSGETVEARTHNVGQGGVGLETPLPLKRGETLEISLNLPGCPEVVQGQAEVVWADGKGKAGLRFLMLVAEARTALDAWIAKALGEREFSFVFPADRQSMVDLADFSIAEPML